MNFSENLPKLPPVPGLPRVIDGGKWTTGHVQGIALDDRAEYVYYSFTTVLVKTDINGKLIGTCSGLTGHLGCISFNSEDGKVYGSIEYKHDSIGQGIMKNTGIKLADEDAFYCAVFDVDKLDRVGMDAEKDGIMKAVYLPDVVNDFNAQGLDGQPHRYACSGIDGTGFGPDFGAPKDSKRYLYIAYGIYGDVNRRDNDHQCILKFDWRSFDAVAKPLTQAEPHHSGITCEDRYFLYTGNTSWGVQNLEYDAYLDSWLTAVYKGKKPAFRNPAMFIIDRTVAPYEGELKGLDGEKGKLLTLKEIGVEDQANGIWGNDFPLGSTGIYAFGNGYYYFSQNGSTVIDDVKYQLCSVKLTRFSGEAPMLFEIIGD